MKCPLKRSKYVYLSGSEEAVFEDCIYRECAWWEERFGKCCIAVDAYLQSQADRHTEANTRNK